MDFRFLPKKTSICGNHKRINFLSVAFLILTALLVLRLFDLQVLRGSFYAALAADQHSLYQQLFSQRGSIYVREEQLGRQILFPLVTNRPMSLLYASPREIENASVTAEALFKVIGFGDDFNLAAEEKKLLSDVSTSTDYALLMEIKNNRREDLLQAKKDEVINSWMEAFSDRSKGYYPIRQKLPDDKVKAIKNLNLKGLGFQEQDYRFYPEPGLGGQIFGFWGYRDDERVGNYGLEGYYDKILAGKNGEIRSERDAWGNIIALGKSSFVEKEDGGDLVLTINRSLQYKACDSLKKSIDAHRATGGSIIVMDPSTGAILAMCSFPDYDPGDYSKVKDASVFNNKAIFDAYEPGSIFKPLTMAAAINEGKVTPETTYVDSGMVDYGQFKIRNFEDKIYGLQNMTNVLEFSLNTGVIFAMRQIGTKTFAEYVRKYGFGQITNLELNKESAGNVANLDKKGEIYAATATFGQGISVTPIQMITAFSSLINGGKLMKPYIVSQIIRGEDVQTFEPQVVRQVITPKTSVIMKGMLVSVVENGHAKKAQIAGYRVGGKTGTAQVVDKKTGGYKKDEIIGSFVGFAPFNDPKIAVFVRVDEPIEGKLGETVAAPVFTEVAKFALQYYNVPHDK